MRRSPPAQGVARRILAVHAAGQREATKGAAAATVEQSLGLLTALCLRYPDGAAAAAEAGCLEAAMEVRLHCIESDLALGFLAFFTVPARLAPTARQPWARAPSKRIFGNCSPVEESDQPQPVYACITRERRRGSKARTVVTREENHSSGFLRERAHRR